MAGNTGRLTAEAIAARGPRMVLTSVYHGDRFLGLVIRREGVQGTVIDAGRTDGQRLKFGRNLRYLAHARSYSLSYLLRIGRARLSEVA